jgi:hypothetical protein
MVHCVRLADFKQTVNANWQEELTDGAIFAIL